MNKTANADALALEFITVDSGVLRFGGSNQGGRLSPFFNAGLFDDGAKAGCLAQFYATAFWPSALEFDMLFVLLTKGIPLAAAVAIELARLGRNVPIPTTARAKDHGRGGTLVGAKVQRPRADRGRCMSAGTAARESIALIRAAGIRPMRWQSRSTGRRWPPKAGKTCPTAQCNTCASSWASGLCHCSSSVIYSPYLRGQSGGVSTTGPRGACRQRWRGLKKPSSLAGFMLRQRLTNAGHWSAGAGTGG